MQFKQWNGEAGRPVDEAEAILEGIWEVLKTKAHSGGSDSSGNVEEECESLGGKSGAVLRNPQERSRCEGCEKGCETQRCKWQGSRREDAPRLTVAARVRGSVLAGTSGLEVQRGLGTLRVGWELS